MIKIIVKRIKGNKLVSKNRRYLKKFDDMTVLDIFSNICYKDYTKLFKISVILKGKTNKIEIIDRCNKLYRLEGKDFKLIEFSEVKKPKEEIIKKPETRAELPEKLSLFKRVKEFLGF